jgi:putative transcriptional regulator
MTRRNIGAEIIEGLQALKAWEKGERVLKTTTVVLPRAVNVSAIRSDLGLSQEQFARLMGVSVATLRNWEQGRREPHGAARSLLQIASAEPAAVLRALVTGKPSAGTGKQNMLAQGRGSYRVSRKSAATGAKKNI